jgi:CheY-like chemotaxis protein
VTEHESADAHVTKEIGNTPSIDVTECYGKRLRVLVVDDSFICQKLLVKGLAKANIDSDTASNGQEAVDMLSTVPCLYDAVLMDLRMPVMDGLTATQICHDKLKLQIPIIVVSAEDENTSRNQALAAGATDYVPKPANVANIIELLNLRT